MIKFWSTSPSWNFLSNFYPCEIVSPQGVVWPSAEHVYQAAKTRIDEERETIRLAKTAKEARALGKTITLRDDWLGIKVSVMDRILRLKFQIPELKEKLLTTGDQELVHWSPWDIFWGVDNNNKGENQLGQLIMKIREELK